MGALFRDSEGVPPFQVAPSPSPDSCRLASTFPRLPFPSLILSSAVLHPTMFLLSVTHCESIRPCGPHRSWNPRCIGPHLLERSFDSASLVAGRSCSGMDTKCFGARGSYRSTITSSSWPCRNRDVTDRIELARFIQQKELEALTMRKDYRSYGLDSQCLDASM